MNNIIRFEYCLQMLRALDLTEVEIGMGTKFRLLKELYYFDPFDCDEGGEG